MKKNDEKIEKTLRIITYIGLIVTVYMLFICR